MWTTTTPATVYGTDEAENERLRKKELRKAGKEAYKKRGGEVVVHLKENLKEEDPSVGNLKEENPREEQEPEESK